jgi:hypothetical protein
MFSSFLVLRIFSQETPQYNHPHIFSQFSISGNHHNHPGERPPHSWSDWHNFQLSSFAHIFSQETLGQPSTTTQVSALLRAGVTGTIFQMYNFAPHFFHKKLSANQVQPPR